MNNESWLSKLGYMVNKCRLSLSLLEEKRYIIHVYVVIIGIQTFSFPFLIAYYESERRKLLSYTSPYSSGVANKQQRKMVKRAPLV